MVFAIGAPFALCSDASRQGIQVLALFFVNRYKTFFSGIHVRGATFRSSTGTVHFVRTNSLFGLHPSVIAYQY